MAPPRETCRWFLLCENVATVDLPHPILGSVPTCQRCADKVRGWGWPPKTEEAA